MNIADQITAAVLTRDEAANVEPCLKTLRWAGEVLVVDSGSSDGTPALAAGAGARVLHRAWDNWAAQRNFAVAQATRPWIFFVDADERVPPELAAEARAAVAAAYAGFEEGHDTRDLRAAAAVLAQPIAPAPASASTSTPSATR
jgi:glycosyltransferase involved in cell wall biosynthesis